LNNKVDRSCEELFDELLNGALISKFNAKSSHSKLEPIPTKFDNF